MKVAALRHDLASLGGGDVVGQRRLLAQQRLDGEGPGEADASWMAAPSRPARIDAGPLDLVGTGEGADAGRCLGDR
jgi:hypothetical protein